jgi:hypothetical protein
MAQTRHGVCAPWRVDLILALMRTENNCFRNHMFRNVKCAETQGFKMANSEGGIVRANRLEPARGVA